MVSYIDKIVQKDLCLGCGLCESISGSQNVKMNFDENGFLYPKVKNYDKNSEEIMPDAQIRIFNLSGNLLFQKDVADDFLIESIDVSGFNAGAYVLEYYKGQFSTKAKFIKQN